jgi:hypothetical protein
MIKKILNLQRRVWGKSEPRRSQRLQIEGKIYTLFYFHYFFFLLDREVVFCDRLEYVHLKLAAATSTPLPERLNKSLSAKQQTVKRKSRSSCGIPSKRGISIEMWRIVVSLCIFR